MELWRAVTMEFPRAHLYVPVLILRDEEIKRLPCLKEAFNHPAVIPFLEIVRDFENPAIRQGRLKKDGSRGKESSSEARTLSSVLAALPEGKAVFVGLYRNFGKCRSQDLPKLFPYVAIWMDIKQYSAAASHLFQYPNVIPVFEMNSSADSDCASSFLDEAKSKGRRVGIRLNAIDMHYLELLRKLSSEDYLFLNLGEADVDSASSSVFFYKDYGVAARLVIIGENHPAALKTISLAPAENEKDVLHGDYFDEIYPYPDIWGVGDYCSMKNVLVDTIRSKKYHPGKANLLIYHHATRGYRILTDGGANGPSGYAEIQKQALEHSDEIDPHALAIITEDTKTGSFGRWNVIGAVHYIYDVLQIVA